MAEFTLQNFNMNYPNEDACVKKLFTQRYSMNKECPLCKKPFKYYKVTSRKCYACQYCGNQIHPLANTIFHKSETPLKSWFYAIFLFSASKNGISAMELQRQLSCTYKTAWRMTKQIRKLFEESGVRLYKKPTTLNET